MLPTRLPPFRGTRNNNHWILSLPKLVVQSFLVFPEGRSFFFRCMGRLLPSLRWANWEEGFFFRSPLPLREEGFFFLKAILSPIPRHLSRQIIATSHDQNPSKGSLVGEMGPLISGFSRLVKYYSICPDSWWLLVYLPLPLGFFHINLSPLKMFHRSSIRGSESGKPCNLQKDRSILSCKKQGFTSSR